MYLRTTTVVICVLFIHDLARAGEQNIDNQYDSLTKGTSAVRNFVSRTKSLSGISYETKHLGNENTEHNKRMAKVSRRKDRDLPLTQSRRHEIKKSDLHEQRQNTTRIKNREQLTRKRDPYTSRTGSRELVKHRSEDPLAWYLSKHRENHDLPQNFTCDICQVLIEEIQTMMDASSTQENIVRALIKSCIKFRLEDDRVCDMMIRQFQEPVLYVVAHLVLAPDEACGLLLGDSCATPYYPGQMWNVTFPSKPKPPPKPPTPPQKGSPTIRVLHITDMHLDFQYKRGSQVSCGEPMCCRDVTNVTVSGPLTLTTDHTAGEYGDYNYCDAPESLVVSLFKHLYTIQDQFDYIIFTGDIPAHDVWNQSQAAQIEHIIALDQLFATYLPDKPVYACVGNHESSPVNSFPPPGIPNHQVTWLYGALATTWGRWLPQEALDTVLRCGGYSVSPFPGFRIISVNNNFCNKGNWWLLLNATDPCDVLSWLIHELQAAEDKGEKVHILTHIPPGSHTCLKPWSHNYYNIISRYENTIVNQFYGHSHHDWYQMFYDNQTLTRPVGFGFVAPSVTPFSFNNPTFRIYTMDGNYTGSSWAVLDYSNFYLNLTAANAHSSPAWQFEYSPKTAYNMNGLYAADWDALIDRMQADDHLFQTFYRYNRNLHDASPCHGNCKRELLCSLIEGRSYDPVLCDLHSVAGLLSGSNDSS